MRKTTKSIFKVALSLTLMVFVFTMSHGPSLFQPAMAAGLGGVRIVPMSNLATMQTTYDIIFTATSTGTIKTVEMDFGSNFNIASATRLIENSGIGFGTLSVSGTVLKYTVSNAVSISGGTVIRLEIARIIANHPGSFTVSITTRNSGNSIIDGSTQSSSFPISAVGPNAVSSGFMLRKTLLDDAAGHAHGWDPDGTSTFAQVSDDDISGPDNSVFVSAIIDIPKTCSIQEVSPANHFFGVRCEDLIAQGAKVDYIITKLPAHVVTSALSVSSSPFDSLLDK
jgi:hypothetical protein